jgi:hypothetical protein
LTADPAGAVQERASVNDLDLTALFHDLADRKLNRIFDLSELAAAERTLC